MLESLFSTSTTTSTISFLSALMTILMALALGGIISLAYIKTSSKGRVSQNFALTVILLPGVIATIILLIGSNIASAFSLAGAFSIIRFRSAPGEPKDIAYVLFTLAAGLACGVGLFGYGILFTIILCMTMLILNWTKFGASKITNKLLQITIPEDLDYEGAFDDIFEQFTCSYELKKVKTAALGSLYQLVYIISTKEGISTKEFLDTIRCRNGNLNITLSLCGDTIEY